jgi:hypothetical protein
MRMVFKPFHIYKSMEGDFEVIINDFQELSLFQFTNGASGKTLCCQLTAVDKSAQAGPARADKIDRVSA